jgi:membrane protein required for colicin V production
MNGFDLALVAVVALSALFAFVRGVIRELIALLTWIIGFVAAIEYAGALASMFPGLDAAPVAKQAFAFAAILVAVMVVGAVVSRLLAGVVRAIGLGFVDRTLGAAFGVARGLIAIVAFALVAGVTALPKRDWWQNSSLGQTLAEAALSLKPHLPRAWAERLDFSAAGTVSARLGEYRSCAES